MTTKNVIHLASQEMIHEEAAMWILRIESSPLSAEEKRELKEWASRSTTHAQVLRDTAEVWDRMDVMEGLAELLPLESKPRSQRLRKYKPAFILGAPLLASVVVLFLFFLPSLGWFSNQKIYETPIGALQVVKMEDGSAVTLNTATKIQAAFDVSQRKIELLKGEAFFEVAHDEHVPFIVTVGTTQIEAVGTAFSVQRLADEVEVTVTEGRVKITKVQQGDREVKPQQILFADGGQQVYLNDQKKIAVQSVKPEEIAKVLMWQQRMLAFNGETLEEVIAEFSRYTQAEIRIVDEETAAIRVGGYFRSDDLPGIMKSLEENFEISVEQQSPNQFVLSKSM